VYTLIGADAKPYASRTPGTLGGHRRNKGYGRLDCPAALRWIAKGHYVRHRVFFADEPTALAAGYRPCATCLPERYAAWKAGRMEVELRPRAPFDADHLLGFLAARAVPHVEVVERRVYRRADVELELGRRRVVARLAGDVHDGVRRVRRVLDLDADMSAVRRVLGPLAAARPGIRNVGAFDAEEIAIRAVVGQQVSVAGARTVLGRLAERYGERVDGGDGVTRRFPRASAMAGETLPMPRSRARALAALATADFARLTEVPGIGPWTADYVRMRLGDPDVLLATDLVVRRALERRGTDGDEWRPCRSYATHQLWASTT
jgi:AraC family transcriptional regulator of adaptative response / DNA-3-methyladenine glycosylase II